MRRHGVAGSLGPSTDRSNNAPQQVHGRQPAPSTREACQRPCRQRTWRLDPWDARTHEQIGHSQKPRAGRSEREGETSTEQVLPEEGGAPSGGKGKQRARQLPWTWLSAHIGKEFFQEGFQTWWQLRTLEKVHGHADCPYCKDVALTKTHASMHCHQYAVSCWTRGIRPEEAFDNLCDTDWMSGALRAASELAAALGSPKEAAWDEGTPKQDEEVAQRDQGRVRLAGAK